MTPHAPNDPLAESNAISLLEKMVRTPSLSGQEYPLARLLASRMSAMGFQSTVDEAGNAIGSRGSTSATHTIVLLGHMDTVPGDIPVRCEGDILHGRGTVDAKGPLAAFISAAARAVIPDHVRVVVIGAVEEEAATSKGARFASTQYRPSACIIGEPSAWDGVTLGYKGRLLVEYELTRACHHSAGPGDSVADEVCAWWSRIRAEVAMVTPNARGVFEQVQASLRWVDTTTDSLQDRVRALAGFRLPPGVEPLQIEEICRRSLGDTGAILTVRGPERAYVADRHSPLARAFTNAIRDHGGQPKLRVKTGTSDMNVVGPIWNCPIVAYGPGDSALDHAPNEQISIAEYLRSIEVLRCAIEALVDDLPNSRQSDGIHQAMPPTTRAASSPP